MATESDAKNVFVPRELHRLYAEKRDDEVGREWLRWLDAIVSGRVELEAEQGKLLVESLMANFLYILPMRDFRPSAETALRLIEHNTTLAILISRSFAETPDASIRLIERTHAGSVGAWKILTLLSPMTHRIEDAEAPGLAHTVLVTAWLHKQFDHLKYCCVDPVMRERVRGLVPLAGKIAERGGNLATRVCPHSLFAVTYAAPGEEGISKRPLNQALARIGREIAPIMSETPNPHKIAVVTGSWRVGHSVWRDQRQLLEELAKDFDLTLIKIGEPGSKAETGLFSNVINFRPSEEGSVSFPLSGEYGLAYYPDFGMYYDSAILANRRLAPIQVTSYGHPVSSHCPEMDYFIASASVEPDDSAIVQERYDERVILLPGRGVAPLPILAERNRRPVQAAKDGEPITIHCAWTAMKTHDRGMELLFRLAERVSSPVRFCFAPGTSDKTPVFYALADRIRAFLSPFEVEIYPLLSLDNYRARVAQAHIAADSIPFGGANTVVDAIHFGVPVVCREGEYWYSRIGAAHLRRINCPELIARDDDAYVEILARLVEDGDWRNEISQRMIDVDLTTTLYKAEDAKPFVQAIKMILDNHETWSKTGDRTPIYIENPDSHSGTDGGRGGSSGTKGRSKLSLKGDKKKKESGSSPGRGKIRAGEREMA